MNKVKLFALTMLAALAIGVGGLVLSPSASAAKLSCERAMALANAYIVIAVMLRNGGDYAASSFYSGKAEGVMDAAC
jgi:hypothetical protein